MKRVLITGADSYIGTNVKRWLMKYPDEFNVKTLDMKNKNYRLFDFSSYDVVFHVAGIAHVTAKKSMKDIYYKVNTDLAIETARIAKKSGIKQFIFMSSMIVYSSKEKKITRETKPKPDNFYGYSKLFAEEGISKLQDKEFNVCFVRAPLIYGPNSKGNFPRLIKLIKIAPFFPKLKNLRSMLYIDNLAELIRLMIKNEKSGIFYPQNIEPLSTQYIARIVKKIVNKKYFESVFLRYISKILMLIIPQLKKIYGNRYYTQELSNHFDSKYKITDNYDSIISSVKGNKL